MALQVFMILFFWLSVALLIGAVLCAVWLFRKKKNLTKGLLTALALLFGSVVAMRMAAGGYLSTGAFEAASEYARLSGFQVILDSVVHGLQSFSMDEDYTMYLFAVQDMCLELFRLPWTAKLAGMVSAVQNVLAPVAGGAVLLDILANIFPAVKLALKKGIGFYNFFVFSELNEDAVCLAEDILRDGNYKKILAANGQGGRPVILFTDDYPDAGEEAQTELRQRANALGAVCVKTDLLSLNLKRAGSIYYFLIDTDRMENLSTLAALAEGKPRWRTRSQEEQNGKTAAAFLYVFTEGGENGAYIRELRKKNRERLRDVVVREVQDYRNMVMNLLYDIPLYAPFLAGETAGSGTDAEPRPEEEGVIPGEKRLTVTIFGSGKIGEEAFRNVYWYGQMYGWALEIHVAGRHVRELKQDLMRHYGELMGTCAVDGGAADQELLKVWPECSGRTETNPPYAGVRFLDYDVERGDFFTVCAPLLKRTHYFVVALGSDRKNMEISGELNRWLAKQRLGRQCGFTPVIACAVFDAGLGHIVSNEGQSGEGGWIFPFGSHESRFCCRNVFLSDFTEQSLASGEIYDKQRQEKDADDEYKTLSSVARVAHASYKYFSEGKLTSVSREGGRLILRPAADIRGTKAGEILTGWLKDPEVSERLAWMEHRRWNAYIRAQGYTRPASESQLAAIYRHGETGMNPKRVDLKIHPCLVESAKEARRKGEPLRGKAFAECDLLDCLSLYLWRENRFAQGTKAKEQLTADDYDYKVWDYPDCDTALSDPGFL